MHLFSFRDVAFESCESLLRDVARELETRELVTAQYADAVVARERESPTGLPLGSSAIAVPHADATFVRAPAIAVVMPLEPVKFRQMGDPRTELAVDVVFVLALRGRDDAQWALVKILERVRVAETREALRRVADEIARGGLNG